MCFLSTIKGWSTSWFYECDFIHVHQWIYIHYLLLSSYPILGMIFLVVFVVYMMTLNVISKESGYLEKVVIYCRTITCTRLVNVNRTQVYYVMRIITRYWSTFNNRDNVLVWDIVLPSKHVSIFNNRDIVLMWDIVLSSLFPINTEIVLVWGVVETSLVLVLGDVDEKSLLNCWSTT